MSGANNVITARHVATRVRARMRTLGVNRLSVHRTPRHIYAQRYDDNSSPVGQELQVDTVHAADNSTGAGDEKTPDDEDRNGCFMSQKA